MIFIYLEYHKRSLKRSLQRTHACRFLAAALNDFGSIGRQLFYYNIVVSCKVFCFTSWIHLILIKPGRLVLVELTKLITLSL